MLRIDFAILNQNKKPILFIEFNGKQHYDTQDAWYSEKGVKSDQLKQEYAKNKNIPLIIIKYDDNINDVMNHIDFSKYGDN